VTTTLASPISRPAAPAATAPRLVEPLAHPGWDAAVARLPGATVFHQTPWLRLIRETYGHLPLAWICGPAESPTAALVVVEVASPLTGRRGVGVPFADHVPPLAPDAATASTLLASARQEGAARGWKHLEVRGWPAAAGELPAPPSTSFWGHTLDLPAPEDLAAYTEALPPAARRALRRAETAGLTLNVSSAETDLQAFYGLFCRTRRRHGTPPPPAAFFQRLRQLLLVSGRGVIVLARAGRRPVAGAVYLHSGATMHYKYGASDERDQQLRANNLVMHHAITWHAQQGFSQLDFGRTSLGNEGLRRFKLGWGPRETRLDYLRFALPSGQPVSAPDRAGGWQTPFFRHLPLGVNRLLGRWLYPHLA
jgi:hypothetical protein